MKYWKSNKRNHCQSGNRETESGKETTPCPLFGKEGSFGSGCLILLVWGWLLLLAQPVLATPPLYPGMGGGHRDAVAPMHHRVAEGEGRLLAPGEAGIGNKVSTTGTVSIIALLVEFKDVKFSENQSYFNGLMDRLVTCYKDNSYGKLKVTYAMATATLNNSMTYYGTKDNNTLPCDAVNAADKKVDFRNYDALMIVHAGNGEEAGISSSDIHSQFMYQSQPIVSADGVGVCGVCIVPEHEGASASPFGIFCHEFGHQLGLPDLYDTDGDSEGIGKWSLMSSGAWNGSPSGSSPAHFDAWCKVKADWITPQTVTTTLINQSIPQAETNPVAYKLWNNTMGSREYFLVENRQGASLPGNGLLIYHVDENQQNNDNQSHYMVAVEQADGKRDLENKKNRGDSGDPYPGSTGNKYFDDLSNPNSRTYLCIHTFVAATNISMTGNNITASLFVAPAATVSTGLSISGFVLDASKKGVEGVLITFNGKDKIATATTDLKGYYTLKGLTPVAACVITPSKSGYTFNPSSKKFKLSTSLKNQNFTAIPPTYSISGKIINANGQGVIGVMLTLSGTPKRTAATKADGSYSFSKVPAGNYQLTPAKKGYSFVPEKITYSPLNSEQLNQDFAAIPPEYSLSGYVFYKGSRKGMGTVSMTISVGSFTQTTATDDKGYYQFKKLPAGSYQLTPSYSSGSFSPKSKNINLTMTLSNQNFYIILPRSSPDYMDVETATEDEPYVYPNPYLPSLHTNGICFVNMLPDSRVMIYTLAGELVTTLDVDFEGLTGWHGKNDNNEAVASGIYFFVGVGSNGMKQTGKIGIVR
ncbi:MAG: M6 family metalloprotease domain-containing protein [Candidatus Desantisbacteria bacterium]